MDTTIPTTLDAAIAALVALDVARWDLVAAAKRALTPSDRAVLRKGG